jgi:nucleoside-diphosphate-sugar epimerase
LLSKILVTGGTGFLGSYIIKALIEKGYKVRAIKRISAKLPFYIPEGTLEQAEWVEGDVLDVISLEEAMEGVDAVIHSAGIVSFLKKERKQMYRVNVDGTANVINMALEKNIKRFIQISSIAALGRLSTGGRVNEERKWEESRINTHYAISKYKAELETWRGISEGLNAVILNPGTILGYGDWNNGSCAIFKTVYKEFKWYSPGVNGFVDVGDVAKTAIQMMETEITGERFIISSENWPFKRLQETIADGLNKKRPSKPTTPFIAGIAWRLEKLKYFFTGKKPLLTKESAKVALSQTFFENDKLLKALPGFSFTPLEESIRETCEKYLAGLNKV